MPIHGNSKLNCEYLGDGETLFSKCVNHNDLLQSDLINLSSKSKLIKAVKSRHYVHFDQPELVIEEVNRIINHLIMISLIAEYHHYIKISNLIKEISDLQDDVASIQK